MGMNPLVIKAFEEIKKELFIATEHLIQIETELQTLIVNEDSPNDKKVSISAHAAGGVKHALPHIYCAEEWVSVLGASFRYSAETNGE